MNYLEESEPHTTETEEKPKASFFPTNSDLGIVAANKAGDVPPMPSYGGKE